MLYFGLFLIVSIFVGQSNAQNKWEKCATLSDVEKCLSCVLQCGFDIVKSVLSIAETAVSDGAGATSAIKIIGNTISHCAKCPEACNLPIEKLAKECGSKS